MSVIWIEADLRVIYVEGLDSRTRIDVLFVTGVLKVITSGHLVFNLVKTSCLDLMLKTLIEDT